MATHLEILKNLIQELHAAGDDERLDVEDYVDLCMTKLESASEIATTMPDDPKKEERTRVCRLLSDCLSANTEQGQLHGKEVAVVRADVLQDYLDMLSQSPSS